MSIEALRQKMHRARTWPPAPRHIAIAASAVAAIALVGIATLSVKSAPHALSARKAAMVATVAPMATPLDAREAAAGPTGAPLLWRIKGPHATIYLFGSVHVLRANMGWMDPRLYSAFDSATEVWFEVPDPKVKPQVKPLTEKAFANQPVLLDGLTEPEKAELAQVLRPYDFDYDRDRASHLKPEIAAAIVNSLAYTAMGYQFDRGADMSFLNLARTYNKPVRGFETVDAQISFLNEISRQNHQDGTTALKHALATYAGQLSPDGTDITTMAACWRTGNEACITRQVLAMRQNAPSEYEILLRRRNANWVPRIEDMTKGSGTIFITVGAAHMVGPDGLVAQLRAAGLTVERQDP